jgi:NADH-quinone oxidoreductase subunit C
MELNRLTEKFDNHVLDVTSFRNEITVTINREALVPVCRYLKNDDGYSFNFLSDICGVDRNHESPRFRVVYHLYSTVHNHRIRLNVPVDDDDPVVDSVTSIWLTADWHERECYDMFGIYFRNHSNLRRILMPEDFRAHPLRKDFPLEGW